MSNIPDKCSRCGAPIDWEEGYSSEKCTFCGKTNSIKNNYAVHKEIYSLTKPIYVYYAAKFLYLVNWGSKSNLTVPTGPFLCLVTINSAIPLSSVSGW